MIAYPDSMLYSKLNLRYQPSPPTSFYFYSPITGPTLAPHLLLHHHSDYYSPSALAPLPPLHHHHDSLITTSAPPQIHKTSNKGDSPRPQPPQPTSAPAPLPPLPGLLHHPTLPTFPPQRLRLLRLPRLRPLTRLLACVFRVCSLCRGELAGGPELLVFVPAGVVFGYEETHFW